MSCTIIVGGQYGSEGKGKVVALLAETMNEPWVVRCGGPNSGHTVWLDGQERILRQVPTAAGHPNSMLMMSAGCAVDEDVLLDEVNTLELPKERVIIDPRAVLISDADRKEEELHLGHIASTCSGTGAALIRRMARSDDVPLASDSEKLRERVRIAPVAPLLHSHLDVGGDVIVEGTQGFGLSLLHGLHWPCVTSRDTTAAGFAAEVGLSPRQITSIIMVIRTFPIRVGGNSGPLKDEISWEDIQKSSGAMDLVPEFTSVTKRLRRVGQFDIDAVRMACEYNRPTAIALMGLDRLDYQNTRACEQGNLTEQAVSFIENVHRCTSVPVKLIGTGFSTQEALWLSTPKNTNLKNTRNVSIFTS